MKNLEQEKNHENSTIKRLLSYLCFPHLPAGDRPLMVTLLCGVRTKSNKLR